MVNSKTKPVYDEVANLFSNFRTDGFFTQGRNHGLNCERLSKENLDYLVRTNRIFTNLVYALPESMINLETNLDSKLVKYINDAEILETQLGQYQSFNDLIYKAIAMSRLYGDAFLVIGVDDGQDLAVKLKPKAFKKISFFKLLNPYQVVINHNEQTITIEGGQRVHWSKVYRFRGVEDFSTNTQFNTSVVDLSYRAFRAYTTVLDSLLNLIETHSVFKYGIKGFTQYLVNDKDNRNRNGLNQRFECVLSGIEKFNALLYDTNTESAEFVNRNYAGLKDLTEELLDWLVSSTNLPKYKILGYSSKSSLSEGSEGERLHWSEIVYSNQERLLSPLYYQLSNTVGIEQPIVEYESVYPLTALEAVQLKQLDTNRVISLIQAGIIDAHEARKMLGIE